MHCIPIQHLKLYKHCMNIQYQLKMKMICEIPDGLKLRIERVKKRTFLSRNSIVRLALINFLEREEEKYGNKKI